MALSMLTLMMDVNARFVIVCHAKAISSMTLVNTLQYVTNFGYHKFIFQIL